jgi:hypothetical protein
LYHRYYHHRRRLFFLVHIKKKTSSLVFLVFSQILHSLQTSLCLILRWIRKVRKEKEKLEIKESESWEIRGKEDGI